MRFLLRLAFLGFVCSGGWLFWKESLARGHVPQLVGILGVGFIVGLAAGCKIAIWALKDTARTRPYVELP